MDNTQLKERHFFVEVEQSKSGKKHQFPGVPCQLSRSPWRVGSRAPALGEHNTEIHGELGISKKEIDTLIREGVV